MQSAKTYIIPLKNSTCLLSIILVLLPRYPHDLLVASQPDGWAVYLKCHHERVTPSFLKTSKTEQEQHKICLVCLLLKML